VDTLERGDLTLEQSLAAFERGVLLTRTCQRALDAAEQKVRILTSSAEGAEPEPFVDE
jgi:exodeoxyribonuclease VII small subunit